MHTSDRIEYLTREHLMNALSDDEVASVSSAESANGLVEGDEYLDLQELGLGVKRALCTAVSMGTVLPRKAVHENTWKKLLAQLAPVSRRSPIA